MSVALEHVLWMGGPPGTGKTTVASILARRHGLRLYSADTRTWVHRDRALAVGSAAAQRWEELTPDERRLQPDADLLAQSLYPERGAMVVDDVALLPGAPMIVAEGTVIRPQDVPRGAAAVWLLSDVDTVIRRLEVRDGQSNRLYELLVDVIATDVAAAGAPTIQVDSLAATVAAVETYFAAQLARGPVAHDIEARRALLREANLDIVAQVRGFYGRTWAAGDPDEVVRQFMCECGARDCEAFVVTSVRSAAASPVLSEAAAGAKPL